VLSKLADTVIFTYDVVVDTTNVRY